MADASFAPGPNGEVPATKWAVIQTGIITEDADTVRFVDAAGKRVPVIIALFDDKEKAMRMRKRIYVRTSKVKGFRNPDFYVSQPVYGVCEVSVPPKRTRVESDTKTVASGRGPGRPSRK